MLKLTRGLKFLNKKGIINVGGPSQTIYKFAKKEIKKFNDPDNWSNMGF